MAMLDFDLYYDGNINECKFIEIIEISIDSTKKYIIDSIYLEFNDIPKENNIYILLDGTFSLDHKGRINMEKNLENKQVFTMVNNNIHKVDICSILKIKNMSIFLKGIAKNLQIKKLQMKIKEDKPVCIISQ
jgi:hypothetical protein